MVSFLPFCFQWRVKCPSKAIFPMVPKHSAYVMYREVTGCFLVWVPTLGRLTQWVSTAGFYQVVNGRQDLSWRHSRRHSFALGVNVPVPI